MDVERCYRAVSNRDARFDGWFVTAVRTTGIYCRPSCPARTPQPGNVRFYPTAAAAQQAGFRACKRCRPDASPGSPEWDVRADLVGRAMRLIRDGVVDRDGVGGLARLLGYMERHVNRVLTEQVGAGALAQARAQRAQTARLLLETTDMPATEVAFAAGFASLRQFNETVRAVYATTPTGLRRSRGRRVRSGEPGRLSLRLPFRCPGDVASTLRFLGMRAVPGVESLTEESDGPRYVRTLRLPHGAGRVELCLATGAGGCVGATGTGHVHAALELADLRDLSAAVARCRRLLDLDADPVAVDAVLAADPLLAPQVAKVPGLRLPGTTDPAELAIRAVLGQQVSVAAARRLAGRLVDSYGEPCLPPPNQAGDSRQPPFPERLFPSMATLADLDPADVAMPRARGQTLVAVARGVLDGSLDLEGGDWPAAEQALRRLPGVGRWTAGYVRMRGLGDPDVWLGDDLGVRRGLATRGIDARDADVAADGEHLRPWRSYSRHPALGSGQWNRTKETAMATMTAAGPTTSPTAPSAVVEAPFGPLVLTATDDGRALARLLLPDAAGGGQPRRPQPPQPADDAPALAAARQQLEEYFAGGRQVFDVPIAPIGTEFQRRVWAALADIPYGETRSYGAVAAAIGLPRAARAVGMANNRNPLPILLPCHRVIGSGGALVGYGGGLPVKRLLLELEARHRQPALDEPVLA